MKKQQEEVLEGTCVSSSVQTGSESNSLWINNDKQIDVNRFCRRELSTFKFITFYKEIDGTDKDVTVILTINYDKKSYSVDPGCGPKTFIFEGSSVGPIIFHNKYPMWKAVLQSINDAIDFAEKELIK
jgi:hypothetical protein